MPTLIRHINLGRHTLETDRPIRSFIAVEIERPELIAKLEAMQREILSSEADLRPVERDNLHITMRFLGDITPSVVERIIDMLSQLKFQAFSASLHGVGVFPKMTFPRVIWVGVAEGHEELVGIHQQIEEGLMQLGFRREHEKYSPHITLFRVRSGRGRERLVEALMKHQDTEFGKFDVRAVQLKRSVLTPNGPVYSTLGETRR